MTFMYSFHLSSAVPLKWKGEKGGVVKRDYEGRVCEKGV